MILNIRSPYFITINESGQVGSKIELFIWKTGSIPATPTYTFTKAIASATQRENVYNISSFIKEFINNVAPTNASTEMWANVTVKRYKETSVGVYSLLDTVNYTAVEAYNNYTGGYNQSQGLANFAVLANPNIDQYFFLNNPYAESYPIPFINVYANLTVPDFVDVTYQDLNGLNEVTDGYNTAGKNIFKVPLSKVNYKYRKGNKCIIKYYVGETLTQTVTFNVYPVCETKYTPVICNFINRFGGWQSLTFFKAQFNNIVTQGNKYNLTPSAVNYNPLIGKTKQFNRNGMQSVRVNTGWVDENNSELIQDLLLSETILLDLKPVTIKTDGTELKTSLNNKMINYEMEFDYSFDLINNVV